MTRLNRTHPPSAAFIVLSGTLLTGSAHAQAHGLGPRLAALGASEAPLSEVFGEITDLTIGPAGEVFVLDGMTRTLRMFTPDLQFVAEVGGEGAGPTEFGAGVLSLSLMNDSVLVVADSRNVRLASVSFDNEGLRVSATTRLKDRPFDVCAVGPRAYYLVEGDNLIHEVGPSGQTVHAFGDRAIPSPDLAKVLGSSDYFLNQASLACDRQTGAVLLIREMTPMVQGFNPDGVLLWTTSLSEYHQQDFRRTREGKCCLYLIPKEQGGTFHMPLPHRGSVRRVRKEARGCGGRGPKGRRGGAALPPEAAWTKDREMSTIPRTSRIDSCRPKLP